MATSEKIQTGFISLGKMGYHIAHNLLKASFSLTVCDYDEKPIQELVRMGAQAVRSPKEVAERSEVVWIMVPYQKAFKCCRPIFEALGSVAKYSGSSGNGHLVKVINNVLGPSFTRRGGNQKCTFERTVSSCAQRSLLQ